MSKNTFLIQLLRTFILIVSVLILSLIDRMAGFHFLFLWGVILLVDRVRFGSFFLIFGFSLLHDTMYVLPFGLTGMVLFGMMTLRSKFPIKILPNWAESGVWGILGAVILLMIELYD